MYVNDELNQHGMLEYLSYGSEVPCGENCRNGPAQNVDCEQGASDVSAWDKVLQGI